MAAITKYPATHRALVLRSTSEPLELVTRPTPTVTSGSAIIRVLCTGVLSYAQEVFTGKRPYDYPLPYVPGSSSVGRIVAIGQDATTLKEGDLVFTDMFLRGRDDENATSLQGWHQGGTAQSTRLVSEEFRDGTYAEYARIPLENLHRMPEGSQYSNPQYLHMVRACVPFGGLTNLGGVDLQAGETVVIAPATGHFGGSGVEVALAMGANVVAMGRSTEGLQRLEKNLAEYGRRLKTVQITGDVEADTAAIGPVNCYLDLSPPVAANSSHIRSCFLALKPRGRVCLMGGIHGDLTIPHGKIYRQNIQITGKWMYERSAPRKILQMVENGLLRLDRTTIHTFGLEQLEEACDDAAGRIRPDELTVLIP